MDRLIDFLKEFGFPFALICLAALTAIMWVVGNAQERHASHAAPEETLAVFQRIGPEFEVDGLYRVDYESKTYLFYQSDHHTVIIEHEAGERP